MKRLIGLALVFTFMSLIALAETKNVEKVTLTEKVMLGTMELAPGELSLSWIRDSAIVQVTVTQGSNSVTAPAKIMEKKNSVVAVLTNHEENGTIVLTGFQLRNVTLEFLK